MFRERLLKTCSVISISLLLAAFSFVSISADQFDVDYTGFDFDNYNAVTYIQSSGTQYIDLNYIDSNHNNGRFVIDYETTTLGGLYYNQRVAGNFDGSRFIGLYGASSVLYSAVGSSDNNLNFNLAANTRYKIDLLASSGQITGTVNGSSVSGTYSGSNHSAVSYYLFAMNQYNTPVGHASIRLYSFKLYDNNSLVRSLIPAVRKVDDVPGVYDTVGHTFYANAGSGSFTFGSFVNPVSYTVTTSVNPSGSGTVTGGGTVAAGSSVTLTATAGQGYVFSQWSNGMSVNPYTFIPSTDMTITAVFVQQQSSYTVTTSVNPSGSGTVTGGGTVVSGSSVTLSASPGQGYVFSHWSNGDTSNPYTFIVNSDVTLVAHFVSQASSDFTITTSVSPSDSGSVTGGGSYSNGSNVTLTATPASGYKFKAWSNGINVNPYTFTATENLNIIAIFDREYEMIAFQKYYEAAPNNAYTAYVTISSKTYMYDSFNEMNEFYLRANTNVSDAYTMPSMLINTTSTTSSNTIYLVNINQTEFSGLTFTGVGDTNHELIYNMKLGEYLASNNWTYTYKSSLVAETGIDVEGYVLSGTSSLTLSVGDISGLNRSLSLMHLETDGINYHYHINEYVFNYVIRFNKPYYGLVYNPNVVTASVTQGHNKYFDVQAINCTPFNTSFNYLAVEGATACYFQLKSYEGQYYTNSSGNTFLAPSTSPQQITNLTLTGYFPKSDFNVPNSERLSFYNYLNYLFSNMTQNLINVFDGAGNNISVSNTVTNITNEYNVDIDATFNNALTDIQGNLPDIELPEFQLPSTFSDHASVFSGLIGETVKIFTDNNIGYLIYIPLIVGVVFIVLL